MPLLKHPETGAHVRASAKTAERLIEEGWTKIQETLYPDAASESEATTEAPTGEPKSDERTPNGGGSTPAAIAPPEKPFDEMKLTELVEYAEKIGMDAAELKKPGMSKAKAKDAINAHIAAQQQ